MLDYKSIFFNFEAELIEELKELPIYEIKKGTQIGFKGMDVNTVPLGIEGLLNVYNIDEEGRESIIYSIGKGQSCIVSITSIFTNEKSPVWAKAVEDSKIIVVKKNKTLEWFSKYPTWRNYVIELYNCRLKELITQHTKVTQQNEKITLQNNQIIESINYAKYIQNAILPPDKILKEYLSDYFIMFKPKAIVSGDFYWTKRDNERIFFAAADATGHGVPGAFMSMLGISLMNEISFNFNGSAAEFLNLMKIKIKEALRQSEYDNSPKDGFDIGLCIFYPKTGILEFAGANNPLILIRKNEMFEIKADKMPVGIYFREKESFTNNFIQLENNDILYLFSDGYRDQFGGLNNEKINFKNFKNLLSEIHNESLNKQKDILFEYFNSWQGSNTQIDDVLVMGVKIFLNSN